MHDSWSLIIVEMLNRTDLAEATPCCIFSSSVFGDALAHSHNSKHPLQGHLSEIMPPTTLAISATQPLQDTLVTELFPAVLPGSCFKANALEQTVG